MNVKYFNTPCVVLAFFFRLLFPGSPPCDFAGGIINPSIRLEVGELKSRKFS